MIGDSNPKCLLVRTPLPVSQFRSCPLLQTSPMQPRMPITTVVPIGPPSPLSNIENMKLSMTVTFLLGCGPKPVSIVLGRGFTGRFQS
jgi:hypothetical protein